MGSRNTLIAAAVAAGLASSLAPGLSHAAPTITYSLVISGSSAALNSVKSAVQTNLCGTGSNFVSYGSVGASANFAAFVCNPTSAAPAYSVAGISSLISATGANTFAIYYRSEGGSVTGALPIATGTKIARLDLSSNQTYVNNTACNITSGSGTADVWSSCTVKDTTQLGITDVEPGKLTFADYPSDYASSAFGSASPTQLANLPKTALFQQVFGLYVNTNVTTGTFENPIRLSKATLYNIYSGNVTDWSQVPDAVTGNPVLTNETAPTPIVEIDRERGSGTRTSADLYFMSYHCGGLTSIGQSTVVQQHWFGTSNFSTGDELNALNSTPGGFAYLSIDNGPKVVRAPAGTVDINGIAPTNLAAAAGQYDYWFEATAIKNTTSGTASDTIAIYLVSALQNLATAPHAPDIDVIPGQGTNASLLGANVPLQSSGTGTAEIYLNPYSRQGNSCNVPTP